MLLWQHIPLQKRRFTMKIRHIFIVLLLVFILASCAEKDNSQSQYMPSETNYKEELDINSPEGLAKASSELYLAMVNGEKDIWEGVEELTGYAVADSAQQLRNNMDEFTNQIKATKDYLESIDDEVAYYHYAATEYADNGVAKIRRIQAHKNGKKYYFEQVFVKEDGQWKIASDNLIDAFEIKSKFLFWYV